MIKRATGIVVFFLVCGCVQYFGFPAKIDAQGSSANAGRKPVLVELFTSEGCSSCPPADALLQTLLAKQPVHGAEIVALEEHVDYWNRLGWIDPYSSAKWTERQSAYAAKFGNDAYTPELVVDGRVNFVGSNAREAEREIEKASLETQTAITIAPKESDQNGSKNFSISVARIEGAEAGDAAEVWLAVTEDGLRSSVSAGENEGRVLNHIATLRSLRKIGVAEMNAASSYSGISQVKLDPRWNAANTRITVFVQGSRSREILGAASIPI
jgi:hypothetical protein